MADYSSIHLSNISKPQQDSIYQTFSNMEESQTEFPNKPNQSNQTNKIRIIPRKNSEQILKTIQNKIQVNNNSQLNQDLSTISQFKSTTITDSKPLNRSSSSQNYSAIYNASNYIKQDKRSSINQYNKRVVELNLNHQQISQKQSAENSILENQFSKISVIPKNIIGSNQISLDISDLGLVKQQQKKHSEVKKISVNRIPFSKNGHSDQMADVDFKSIKNVTISVQISPKATTSIKNVFSSPRLSEHQVLSTMSTAIKNKLIVCKQSTNKLNKSDQFIFCNTSDLKHQKLNSVKPCRSNSPSLEKTVRQYQQLNDNQRKRAQFSQLNTIKNNLSTEKSLRIHASVQDLQKGKGLSTLSMKEAVFKRANANNGQINSRLHSPSDISIHKALSRISSVEELQIVKDQKFKQRKSIQSNNRTSSKLAQTTNIRKTVNGLLNNPQIISQEHTHCFSDSEEDNDYFTNQEKLWNAIETRQSIDVIKDLLSKEDVIVDARNIFHDGWTALHYAVHEGYLEVIELLIEQYQANIDSRSTYNKTPFHFACRKGEDKIIQYLLEKGANPQVVD